MPDVKQHKWSCVVNIPITQAEAVEAVKTGKVDRDVTLKDIEYMGIGCYTCEDPLTRYNISTPCKGEPTE